MKNRKYINTVVDLIMKNDVDFNMLIKKETNRFVVNDYYVTKFFDIRFTDPMAFFNGPNWVSMEYCIRSKYGIGDEVSLAFIKSKISSRFRDVMDTLPDKRKRSISNYRDRNKR